MESMNQDQEYHLLSEEDIKFDPELGFQLTLTNNEIPQEPISQPSSYNYTTSNPVPFGADLLDCFGQELKNNLIKLDKFGSKVRKGQSTPARRKPKSRPEIRVNRRKKSQRAKKSKGPEVSEEPNAPSKPPLIIPGPSDIFLDPKLGAIPLKKCFVSLRRLSPDSINSKCKPNELNKPKIVAKKLKKDKNSSKKPAEVQISIPTAKPKEKKPRNRKPSPKTTTLCPHCGKTYRLINLHIATAHEGKNPRLCGVPGCNEAFKNSKKRGEHIFQCHPEVAVEKGLDTIFRPSLCEFCSKEFPSTINLYQHVLAVHRKKKKPLLTALPKIPQPQIECEMCKKSFRANYLTRHMDQVHGNNEIPCPQCGKTFRCNQYMKEHVQAVHPVDPARKKIKKVAPEQGKRWRENVKRKKLEMRYNCPICEEEFLSQKDMENHLERLHEEKNLQCPMDDCTCRFATSNSLEKHIGDSHEKEYEEAKKVKIQYYVQKYIESAGKR